MVNNILAKDITSKEHAIVIAFLATNLIYNNVQRPGVVQNMTIQRFHNGLQVHKDKIQIKVLKHKTVASKGPVIISLDIESLMIKYYEGIRSEICAQSKELNNCLFLTHKGNKFRKISETTAGVA